MIKILKILKELNIGLATLNQEMNFLGLEEYNINSKVSERDKRFIVAYFNTDQIAEIDKLRNSIAILHNQLKSFFYKNNPDPHNMGSLEKRQFFKFLLSKKNITAPNVRHFTEESFWQLYNWYVKWRTKTDEEKEREIDEAYSAQIKEKQYSHNRLNSIDYESEIMSALRHGEGDIFGF